MKHKSQRHKFVHFWHPSTAYHACHGLEKKWAGTSLKAIDGQSSVAIFARCYNFTW